MSAHLNRWMEMARDMSACVVVSAAERAGEPLFGASSRVWNPQVFPRLPSIAPAAAGLSSVCVSPGVTSECVGCTLLCVGCSPLDRGRGFSALATLVLADEPQEEGTT